MKILKRMIIFVILKTISKNHEQKIIRNLRQNSDKINIIYLKSITK